MAPSTGRATPEGAAANPPERFRQGLSPGAMNPTTTIRRSRPAPPCNRNQRGVVAIVALHHLPRKPRVTVVVPTFQRRARQASTPAAGAKRSRRMWPSPAPAANRLSKSEAPTAYHSRRWGGHHRGVTTRTTWPTTVTPPRCHARNQAAPPRRRPAQQGRESATGGRRRSAEPLPPRQDAVATWAGVGEAGEDRRAAPPPRMHDRRDKEGPSAAVLGVRSSSRPAPPAAARRGGRRGRARAEGGGAAGSPPKSPGAGATRAALCSTLCDGTKMREM
jgi:hypothetical protein